MSQEPDKNTPEPPLDLSMPRDPKLPATELLEVPEEREDEPTGVGDWPEAPSGVPFDDATLPGVDAVTLDEPVPEPSEGGEESPAASGDGEGDATDWDETTIVDRPPKTDS